MEKRISNVLVLFFILNPLFVLLNLIIDVKAYIVYIFFLLIAIFYIGEIKINKKCVFAFLFLLIYSIFSAFRYNYLYGWLGMMFLLFIYSFPWFILSNKVTSWNTFLDILNKKMNWFLVNNMILLIYSILNGRKMLGNMEISYELLPLCIFSLYFLLKRKNRIRNLIVFASSFVCIIIIGSRGPLLCILSFVCLYLLFNIKKHIKVALVLLTLFIIICFNSTTIINYSVEKLNDFGLKSRTLNKLQEKTITSDTGRKKIYDVVLQSISENWILGMGIGGERPLINEEIYSNTKEMNSCYPHNIFLEVVSNYGIILGSIVIIIFIFNTYKKYTNSNGKTKDIIVLLFSIEFTRLLISSSYIRSPIFFILLGIIILNKKEKALNENSYNSSN